MRLYQIGFAALSHLQTSVWNETEGIKSSDKILLSSIRCTNTRECAVLVWTFLASTTFTFRQNTAVPKSCPSFYLKRQWFRAEGFGEIQWHCPGKIVLKVEFSLQSTGPVIHTESHILGRFKQRIYFCIITLESIPGFSSVHQLVYICLFPVHQNTWN